MKLIDRQVRIDAQQLDGLRALRAATGRPVASYIREGVDMVLQEHQGGRECQESTTGSRSTA